MFLIIDARLFLKEVSEQVEAEHAAPALHLIQLLLLFKRLSGLVLLRDLLLDYKSPLLESVSKSPQLKPLLNDVSQLRRLFKFVFDFDVAKMRDFALKLLFDPVDGFISAPSARPAGRGTSLCSCSSSSRLC